MLDSTTTNQLQITTTTTTTSITQAAAIKKPPWRKKATTTTMLTISHSQQPLQFQLPYKQVQKLHKTQIQQPIQSSTDKRQWDNHIQHYTVNYLFDDFLSDFVNFALFKN